MKIKRIPAIAWALVAFASTWYFMAGTLTPGTTTLLSASGAGFVAYWIAGRLGARKLRA